METEVRNFLESQMPSEERLRHIVAPTGPDGVHPSNGWVYDTELGFLHTRARHSGDGVNGTETFYDYEEDGARKLSNFPDRSSRIHTYGDSFTHCDQVNDGETWQECLAAHLQEPIRNYGVGGYSVYQAYRRMRKVSESGRRAEYIILNIFDDDHYRNLVSWIRRSGAGFTRPHLRVNVGAGTFVECEHPIGSADDLHRMRDIDFLCAEFGEDPLLYLALAQQSERERAVTYLAGACARFGVAVPESAAQGIEAAGNEVFTEAALFATKQVVQLVESFCEDNGIELMFVLSYREGTIRSVLDGGQRFDEGFVDWLLRRSRPVVDMCQCFKTEFEHSTYDLDAFVRRFYIGHHTPFGNAYAAWAMMNTVVEWLEPVPLPYRSM